MGAWNIKDVSSADFREDLRAQKEKLSLVLGVCLYHNKCLFEGQWENKPKHFTASVTNSSLSCLNPEQRGSSFVCTDKGFGVEAVWEGGGSCRLARISAVATEGLHCNSYDLHFLWPEGSHDSCERMLWGVSCFHLTLTGSTMVQHYRERIFPLSMTSPSQEWREKRGHSWWPPRYHLLLSNS